MEGDSFFKPGTPIPPKCEKCGKRLQPGHAVEWARGGQVQHADGACETGGWVLHTWVAEYSKCSCGLQFDNENDALAHIQPENSKILARV